MQQLNQCISDFFALGSTFFNPNRPSPIPTTSLTQIVPGAQPSGASATPPNSTSAVPTYQLNRDILTITDVWREYSVGFPGKPSIQSLEAQFGTAWRKDRKESRFFSRRKELYKAIEKKVEEERRVQMGASLDKLRSAIKESNNNND
jgi:hypothetical protein